MFKIFLILGSINGFLAVGLGAFGAHGLKGKLPADLLEVYQTGVQYHMYHAIALVFTALLADRFSSSSLVHTSGWAFLIGIILFSGSLYALSLSGIRVLGAITPIGGVAFLVGWILLAVAAMKSL
ncbi:DUF423 domain-containing protein [Ammoniphilus resinae]|uniref:Uncharacterized membrane protein YgdD (TMEM256/DUF423 family) n=1 Tax=Ammoniphilus resinae TaxID=861532 RepID=A0ABS4GIZ7_9BACL|nr:DUF423 domain-containing protein [Ammoniphilus resinae]MBP1930233.1 uncharacterized membrane protein YgdD (TMEM256/DUF423 family) [Ammoniphilus resinae]